MNTITRFDPFRGLATLQEQMNRFFDGTRVLAGRPDDSSFTSWAPAVDIHETENELVVRADLPGLEEKDLDVRVENNMLSIRGERQIDKSVSEDNYLRVERVHGSFSRSFSLPTTVNPDAIKADYTKGVLTVRIPKREESKPKQVRINLETKGK